MSKEFSFPNKGTCSKQTNFVLNDDHTIASIAKNLKKALEEMN